MHEYLENPKIAELKNKATIQMSNAVKSGMSVPIYPFVDVFCGLWGVGLGFSILTVVGYPC